MSSPLGATQQPGVIFRTDVNLSKSTRSSFTGAENLVRDLAKDDFEAIEDGMKQSTKLHEATPDGNSATRQ